MTVVATVILLIKIISRFLRGASQQLIMRCFLRVFSVNRFFTIEMTVVATVILLIKSLPVTYLISLIYNVLKLLKNKPTYYIVRVIGLPITF